MRLLQGIKKPFHLYYGDSKEIEIASRAPSGKGIFVNIGYEGGFREDMEFITNNINASSSLSFRTQSRSGSERLFFFGVFESYPS